MGKAKKGATKGSGATKARKAPAGAKAKKGAAAKPKARAAAKKAPAPTKKAAATRKPPAATKKPAKKTATAKGGAKGGRAGRVTPAMLESLANELDVLLPSGPAKDEADGRTARERDFRRNFRDHAVPALLGKLLEFDLAHEGVQYAPEFELYETPSYEKPGADFDAWFHSPAWRRDGTDLVHFGEGVADGLIALWLYPGRNIENAPVVYLDSENVGNGVIASDMREFLSLLATNRPFYGWRGDEPEFGDPSQETAAANAELRKWVRSTLRIDPSPDPVATAKAARGRHPDFQAWLSTVPRG